MINIKSFHIAILFSIAMMTMNTGCATLLGDKTRTVNIQSEPEGASVLLNGMKIGTTPMIYKVPDNSMSNPGKITLKLDGYETQSVVIDSGLQMVAILNLANLLCWGVDFITGNMFELKTKFVNVELERD